MNIGNEIIIAILGCIGVVVSSLFIIAIKALYSNTVAVKILSGQMKEVVKSVSEIPKMKEDLRTAHRFIKELKLQGE